MIATGGLLRISARRQDSLLGQEPGREQAEEESQEEEEERRGRDQGQTEALLHLGACGCRGRGHPAGGCGHGHAGLLAQGQSSLPQNLSCPERQKNAGATTTELCLGPPTGQ